jgi:hypothetical protein
MAQNSSGSDASNSRDASIASLIVGLKNSDSKERESAAGSIFQLGRTTVQDILASWLKDAPLRDCLRVDASGLPEMVVGIAVEPHHFEEIQAAMGMPHLADVPPDQDAKEFELEFAADVRLDVLTTRDPRGGGAIARYLEKLGEGIQQIEIFVNDIECATQILRERFALAPIYPAVRAGANGTRVNFFLAPGSAGKKVLVELVEEPPKS